MGLVACDGMEIREQVEMLRPAWEVGGCSWRWIGEGRSGLGWGAFGSNIGIFCLR